MIVDSSALVLHTKAAPPSLLPAALQRTGMEVVPSAERHALVVTDVFATYGRGRQPSLPAQAPHRRRP